MACRLCGREEELFEIMDNFTNNARQLTVAHIGDVGRVKRVEQSLDEWQKFVFSLSDVADSENKKEGIS